MIESKIKEFKAYLERLHFYSSAVGIMSFDSNTIAPKGGVGPRAKRSGFFAGEIFKMTTSDELKQLLDALEPHLSELDDATKGQYRLAKKRYDIGVKIPSAKVQEMAALSQESYMAWEEAKVKDDFSHFAPYLSKVIKLSKEIVAYRAEPGQNHYNILLDDYEEGMTMAEYDEFFEKLKATIVPLLKKIVDSGVQFDNAFAFETVPIESQRKISKFIAEDIGYDILRGYIGETAHPFCSSTSKYDVRITTKYHENDFIDSLFSVLHECGHAIYEQGCSDDIADTNLDRGVSMGVHESQSRFYENIIGRSLEYWNYILPELKKFLPESFQNITAEQFYHHVNIAKPSLIRIKADELTYSLHVMIRYEVEKLLFNSEIDINDLPKIWNEKYKEYLGIEPPNNSLGVLQDVHWSWGAFGYFPTYSLGSAYASQLLAYMQKDIDVYDLISKGEFSKITDWLKEKIHKHGSVYTPKELVKKIGEPIDSTYYAEYLKNKFEKIYNL